MDLSILIGGALLGLYALLLLACRPRLARGELPLASSWIPWVGQAIEYIRNPRRGLAAWARAYPRGFTLPICGTLLTVFVSQELIQYFFKAPFSEVAHLSSKEYVAALMPVVPMSNRPGSDEDNAAVTIFKRYLTPRWMRTLPTIVEETLFQVNRLPRQGGVINIVEWAMDVVLGSTSAIIVGSKPFARDEEWKREMRLFEDLTDTALNLQWVNTPLHKLFVGKAMKQANVVIARLNKFLWESPPQPNKGPAADTLSLPEAFLVAEAEGTAPSISREEFGMECFFFLVASIANTNATLVLVLYELLRRSELQEKVLAQAAAALAAHGGVWCDAAIDEMPLLYGVIQETLRTHLAPMHARIARKDLWIGDVFVPKGRVIAVPTYLQHMNPSIFPNPEVFDPARTTRNEGRGLNFLAFGGGGHKCLGLRLAELELFVGVVELLSRFRATIVGGTPDEALDPLRMRVATLGLPLPPKHLASVRLEPRA